MKVNMIKVISHLTAVINNGINEIKNAENSEDTRRLANYYTGCAATIVEMSNAIDDEDASEEIAQVGLEMQHDIYQAVVSAASRILDYDLAAKAAKKRDEVTQELTA